MTADNTLAPDTTALFERFESRAKRLKSEAYVLLFLIFLLLAFGGIIVYQAPLLTSSDISPNLRDKLTATDNEITKLSARSSEINQLLTPALKKCVGAYSEFFGDWEKRRSAEKPDDNIYHAIWFQRHLPGGSEIAEKINEFLKSPEIAGIDSNIGLQIIFDICQIPTQGQYRVSLIMNRDTYKALSAALVSRDFDIDRATINSLLDEQNTDQQQLKFLTDVHNNIYSHEVEEQAVGAPAAPNATASQDYNTQVLRLVQTSITRFGTLAVVSFLVTILLPLYRYNVRLAAFYRARADSLLLLRGKVNDKRRSRPSLQC